MANARHDLGLRAESAAASWLSSRGWHVLARRWRSGHGELDLICVDPLGTLVGVEVKLRRTGRAGTGPEAIDRRRLARLRRSLAAYAAASPASWPGLRIDLVSAMPVDELWRLERLAAIDEW
ncbi:MAG: YraN family protein [Chloroflexota bacterium]